MTVDQSLRPNGFRRVEVFPQRHLALPFLALAPAQGWWFDRPNQEWV
jgi:hypothetical protein